MSAGHAYGEGVQGRSVSAPFHGQANRFDREVEEQIAAYEACWPGCMDTVFSGPGFTVTCMTCGRIWS
jgi:hypothetical protein